MGGAFAHVTVRSPQLLVSVWISNPAVLEFFAQTSSLAETIGALAGRSNLTSDRTTGFPDTFRVDEAP
jgi:hypothetical protein